jgi:NAD-dependent SIR2 family protein deacetylase
MISTYKDYPQISHIEHKDFRISAAWEFIMGLSGRLKPISRGKKSQQASLDPQASLKQQKYITLNIADLLSRYEGGDHIPAKIHGRSDYVQCRLVRKVDEENDEALLQQKTFWQCQTCDQPLCLTVD